MGTVKLRGEQEYEYKAIWAARASFQTVPPNTNLQEVAAGGEHFISRAIKRLQQLRTFDKLLSRT